MRLFCRPNGRIDILSLHRLVLWPLAAVLALAVAAFGTGQPAALLAVLAGGFISMVPSMIVAQRFKAWRDAAWLPGLGRMLAWQAGKWILTAAGFAAVFIGYRGVPALWLFGGFIIAQLAHMSALMRTGQFGNTHGRRHADQL